MDQEQIHLGENTYNIDELLGHGAFGNVYSAYDQSGHKVALKIIKFENDTEQRMAANEIKILGKISHRCKELRFLCLIAAGMTDTHAYIVSEYVPEPVVVTEMNQELIPNIFQYLMLAVAYLHSKNILHLDIKPENILFSKSTMDVKLIDFGLACKLPKCKILYDDFEPRYGTIDYMAPELLDPDNIEAVPTPASDVYSLGATFFEVLTGTKYTNLIGFDEMEDMGFMEQEELKHNRAREIILENYPTYEYILDMVNIDPSTRPNLLALFSRFSR